MDTLDQLRALGCTITITGWVTGQWMVQLSAPNGEDWCTARAWGGRFADALREALAGLVAQAERYGCNVDVEALRRVAAESGAPRCPDPVPVRPLGSGNHP